MMSPFLLPFVASACYGLSYVLIERILGTINVTTFMVINAVAAIVTTFALWVIKQETVTFSPMLGKTGIIIMVILASLAPAVGWIVTNYAIKNTSAVYTAMGEVSYPVFAVCFAFLLFGVRHWDASTLIGGVLIMLGSFIMIYGQSTIQTDG